MTSVDPTITISQAEAVLSRWLGCAVCCSKVESLHGGYCYGVQRLYFDSPPWQAVIKIDPGPTGLDREHGNLLYTRCHTRCPCPEPYLADSSLSIIPYGFLLLESLPGKTLESAAVPIDQRRQIDLELADALLDLHSHGRETFGGINDAGTAGWLDIFLPKLLELRQDMQAHLESRVLDLIDAACRAAPEVLADQGPPTLVHGDVWAGNTLIHERPDGWHLSGLIDWPALQYADVEYELSYLEAWQTIGPTFFGQYARVRPLRPGYQRRRLFYWLHTYMLHVWLFGKQRYCDLTARTAEQISQQL